MAVTVGGHQITTFTNPVNGQTPIDANIVRGNDNSIKTIYDAHDADPTIHLQSSGASALPAFGTAGRVWLETDANAVIFKYDTGSAWVSLNYLQPDTSGNVTIAGTLSTSQGTATIASPASHDIAVTDGIYLVTLSHSTGTDWQVWYAWTTQAQVFELGSNWTGVAVSPSSGTISILNTSGSSITVRYSILRVQ